MYLLLATQQCSDRDIAVHVARNLYDAIPDDPQRELLKNPAVTALSDYMMENKQAPFIRNIVERMLAYGLGRDLKHYDEAAILKIIAALEKDNYSARTLISEVALSYPFQFQHPNPDDE